MTPPAATTAQNTIPKETFRQTISEGKALIKDGKPKIEAAKAIFQKLKGADKATIVAAFRHAPGGVISMLAAFQTRV